MEKITQIVVIDPTVEDYQSLAPSAEPRKKIFILDRAGDGVEQITELLASYTDLDAVHIVSHGGPGNLQLGSIQLNSDNLDEYGDRLEQWKKALAPNADILLYACNVAAEIAPPIAGRSFLQRLNQLTGADIAASKNLTGSAALGGDWDLEVTIGSIETPLAFTQEAIASYDRVLGTINVTTTADEDNGILGGGAGISLREAIRYSATGDTINLPGGTFTLTIAGANEDLGATGDLDITKNLTIMGAGTGNTTINTAAGGNDRVFHVLSGNTFSISGATISGGNIPGGNGGGIFNEGTLTVANCTFQNNQANGGGAIHNNGTQMTVTGSTFNSLNTAGGGGAIFNNAPGTIDSSIISNNKATGFGGAGIRNQNQLSITNSSITSNEVTNQGGGGIYNEGTLTIAGTTFSGNKASDATDPFSGGGAIYSNGTLNISNSTLSGNTAVQKGGAIWWIGTGSITNSTITNNTADSDSNNGVNDNGGGIFSESTTIALRNTIIARNLDASTAAGTIHPDVSGNITGNNNNLIGSLTGNTGTLGTGSDIVNPTPGLAALANNGGPTQTHVLLPGSPAVDKANSAIAPATDQRGLTRPSGS